MEIYKKMYLRLFNAVTDALEAIQNKEDAAAVLIKAQQDCEEMYINADEA